MAAHDKEAEKVPMPHLAPSIMTTECRKHAAWVTKAIGGKVDFLGVVTEDPEVVVHCTVVLDNKTVIFMSSPDAETYDESKARDFAAKLTDADFDFSALTSAGAGGSKRPRTEAGDSPASSSDTATTHVAVYTEWDTPEAMDAVYARATSMGAAGVLPPEDKPWGMRWANLRDPWGVVWQLAWSAPAQPAADKA